MYLFIFLTLCALLISNTRAQCSGQPNAALVGLKVQYDLNPDETSIEVKTFSGSITTTPINLNAASEVNAYKEANICLGRKTLSEISIKDSGGNGFFGSGYAAVSVNDRLLATVSDFGDEVSYMFYADTVTCNSDEIPFVLDIKYDSSPESTSWTLTDTNSGSVILSNSNVGNTNYLANKFLTVTQCVSVNNKVYQFSITNDDGFTAPAFYRIFADYDLIKVGNGFTGTETQEFTLDGSTTPIPITVSPTPVPVPVDPNSCVDNFKARFQGEDGDGNSQMQPCVWLDPDDRAVLKETYCQTVDARAACPHTCGVCVDDECADEQGVKFTLNGRFGYNCGYIRNRLTSNYDRYFNDFCTGGDGAEKCKKTCRKCNA